LVVGQERPPQPRLIKKEDEKDKKPKTQDNE